MYLITIIINNAGIIIAQLLGVPRDKYAPNHKHTERVLPCVLEYLHESDQKL